MSRKILLKKATRIEGNADIHIQVQDGRVEAARFMVQDFRGFEKLTQGKAAASVPHIVSRICGLCSIAHQVAGFRAFEVKAECKAVWLRRKGNTLEKTPSPASTDLRSIVDSTIIIL
jgi:coenzyme F420-reducing hydrogenase alpha subunit